ncbi:hypothetical protein BU24DRAFT_422190 [Aaosphaeria arxii CBS 175.79]|uniref:Small ribosomal subunit protein mS29 n=1 Tax=Aaosphaeria arxii CBS 175.79 TaxID=1450172 RepID=A0A6A5XRF2_9PLEO|nr:uncharacterized protein BU24DRAFT_422190 [Aaosphaeria arxii CBS 175.79]KAF2015885.1 hypothetical protein BU24DRAFT_422190 [Aaosphaeria arxii CBS 175.79]
MSSSMSLRGLSQLSLDAVSRSAIPTRSLMIAPQASCFSTSAARYANPTMKKKGMGAAPKKGVKSLRITKSNKDAAGSGKRPAPGERKAMRKRIVLSNDNALEVAGLQDLTAENALDASHQGKVRGIPEEAVDALRAVEAFKPRQGWSLFRRPAVLMRKETMELAQIMKKIESSEKSKKESKRIIVYGERMGGKSTLLLQGITMAFLRKWTIINLPEGQDIVNAHTDYAPLPGSQPLQYTQDTYTAGLLSQIVKANQGFLAATKVSAKHDLPLPLSKGATLKQLAELGAANPEAAWPVFVALWTELTQPGRPPILVGVDGLSHIMRESEYLNSNVKPIHAHDLTIVRHFVDLFSGKTALPNGGLVLGVTSGSNSPANSAIELSIAGAEARQSKSALPQWNPYKAIDQRAVECLKNVDVLKVSGISKEEARSIMDYYAESGVLRAQVNEGFVSERWSLAGMGNIGELERATVRLRV